MTQTELDSAFADGERAQRDGHPRVMCPHEPETLQTWAWHKGWEAADLHRKLQASEAAPHRAALTGLELAAAHLELLGPGARSHLRNVLEELQAQLPKEA